MRPAGPGVRAGPAGGPGSITVAAVADDTAQAAQTFTVDPAYRKRWARYAMGALILTVPLAAGGVLALVVRNAPLAAILFLLAVVAGVGGGFARHGAALTVRTRYALTVGPDGLLVVWRDKQTRLPWTDLEYAAIVDNGPLYRALEVQPRPGAQITLPAYARPRPSKRYPDRLEVFVLSTLGDREAACVAEVSDHLPLR